MDLVFRIGSREGHKGRGEIEVMRVNEIMKGENLELKEEAKG